MYWKIAEVASFTDAWIETMKVKETGTAEQSHLLQMRGLKPNRPTGLNTKKTSHLLQMRGLKPSEEQQHEKLGASHLLQMRGLKQSKITTFIVILRRIFYRCVD